MLDKREDNLNQIPCKCGGKMVEIINAEKGYRVGWWCIQCDDFKKAIGRERVFLKLI